MNSKNKDEAFDKANADSQNNDSGANKNDALTNSDNMVVLDPDFDYADDKNAANHDTTDAQPKMVALTDADGKNTDMMPEMVALTDDSDDISPEMVALTENGDADVEQPETDSLTDAGEQASQPDAEEKDETISEDKDATISDGEEKDEEYEALYNKYYNKRSAADVIWHDRKKRTRAFFIFLLILVILAGAAWYFIDSKLDLLFPQANVDDSPTEPVTLNEQIIYDDNDYEMMSAIENATSLKSYLYQWANNGGELMSSKNVINVLLLGLDSGDALENGGRSDVNMIVSLNKKTKTINMASLYRDTWTYMNVDNSDRYSKLNAAYFYGGPAGIIDTVEKDFKIDIDFYVAVDFSSFVDIINALGGITLEVQQYEAEYINRTTRYTIDYGPAVTLTGEEALVFARIRHSDADSDFSRTRRQRQVITVLFSELKTASMTQINNAINVLFRYVKTDLTRTQIVSYASQALAFGWVNYPLNETVLNDNDVLRTGYVGTASAVFMDFPLAANRLQTAIYGESNIVLPESRKIIFNLVK